MTTKVLSATVLALLVGVSMAAIDKATAQSGGEARSNDREMKKALDDKHLTPICPIRRVGPDSWPAAKDPKPTNLPPETTGQSASSNEEDESSKQDEAKRTAAQQDPKPSQRDAAQQNQAAPKQDAAEDHAAQLPNTAKRETKPQQGSHDRRQAQQPATRGSKQESDQDRDKSFASIRLGTDKEGRVAVNDAQERQIAKALRKHDIKTFDADAKIGAAAPADVRLGAVSADLVAVLPQFRGYSFFATRDQLAIVEPDSNKIVALVPVKLTTTASKPREERTTTRKSVRKERDRDREVKVGRGAPSEAEILAAPVVTAPAGTVVTRGYRSYRVEVPAETVIIERRPRLFGLW